MALYLDIQPMDKQFLLDRSLRLTTRWALFVGINHYHDEHIHDLRYCASDSKALAQFLLSQSRYGYSKSQTRILTSEDAEHKFATRRAILSQLLETAQSTKEDDLMLFYFSGHGACQDGEAYLIPADASATDLFVDTAIPLHRIKQIMRDSAKARAKVIIVDACHIGVRLSPRSLTNETEDFMKSVFESAEGLAVLAASAQDERSWEDPEKQHGIFTYYLLDGLRGSADRNADAQVTLNELANYVTEKLSIWSSTHSFVQRPTLDYQGTGEIILLTGAQAVSGGKEPPGRKGNPVTSTFPMAVRYKQDFYDRRAALDQVRQELQDNGKDPQSVVLIRGERRLGKTSFINRIKTIISEEDWNGHRFLISSLEPGAIRTVGELAREMWGSFTRSLQEADILPVVELEAAPSFNSPFSTDSFVHQLTRLGRQLSGVTFIVIMDEFDKMKDIGEIEFRQMIDLVHTIVEKTEFPVLFFVSLLQPLPSHYGSDIPFKDIALPPFERTEIESMIRALLVGYAQPDESALTCIFELSGGQPYFSKLLLSNLYELGALDSERNSFSSEAVIQSVHIGVKQQYVLRVLEEIYHWHFSESERRAVLFAAKMNRILTKREIESLDIGGGCASLERRGYLHQPSKGEYQLRLGLLAHWVEIWPDFQTEWERLRLSPPPKSAMLPSQMSSQINPRGVCVDVSIQQIYVEGEIITEPLTQLQYSALEFLAKNSYRIVPRDELSNHLHPNEVYMSTDQSIDTLVHRLRLILHDTEKPAKYLLTFRKRGVQLKDATLVRTRPT